MPATIREFVENPSDNGDFPFVAQCQRNSLILNALAFARSKNLDRLASLVEQEAAKAVSRLTASPVALLGNLHATAKHFVAEFAAVLRSAESFKLHIDRVEWIVLTRLAERRVNDLFAVFSALRAVLSGQIDVLEPAPAAHVQAEDVLEVVPFLHPVLHHVLKRWPSLGRQPGLAGIHEFVDTLHTVALCPGAYLILLNRDRVLLAILRRVSVVRNPSVRELRLLITRVLTFPPVSHVFASTRCVCDDRGFVAASNHDVAVAHAVRSLSVFLQNATTSLRCYSTDFDACARTS